MHIFWGLATFLKDGSFIMMRKLIPSISVQVIHLKEDVVSYEG